MEAVKQHLADVVQVRVDDAVWLASGPRGRRIIRRVLRDANIDIGAARIVTSFPVHSGNYGQMCFAEGARARALNILVELMRALATGELKLESWQLLVMERDDG